MQSDFLLIDHEGSRFCFSLHLEIGRVAPPIDQIGADAEGLGDVVDFTTASDHLEDFLLEILVELASSFDNLILFHTCL